jgi:hypothetical protein
MVMTCEHVWQEISNFLEGDIDAEQRAAMEEHLRGCKHCSAVLDGTRNVIELYGDDRVLEVPLGFSQRLHRRLAEQMPQKKRTNLLGWRVAFAAACLLVVGLAIERTAPLPPPPGLVKRATPAGQVPPDLMVVVDDSGKLFHLANCGLLQGKQHFRVIPASLAMKEGFTPCPLCVKKFFGLSASLEEYPHSSEQECQGE